MNELYRLKLAAKSWAGHTGCIGTVDFVDGVSVVPVPRFLADRLSAAIQMILIDDEGNEVGPAGVAARLIRERAMRAPVLENLDRQSDAERKTEELQITLKDQRSPTDAFYTVEQLQAIADEKGIKGLRVVAEPWNVRGKAIPSLIEQIMAAQNKFLENKGDAIKAVVEAKAEESPTEVVEEKVEKVEDDQLDLLKDARTDIADVINAAIKSDGAFTAQVQAVAKEVTSDLVKLPADGDTVVETVTLPADATKTVTVVDLNANTVTVTEKKVPDAEPVGDFVNSAAVLALTNKV